MCLFSILFSSFLSTCCPVFDVEGCWILFFFYSISLFFLKIFSICFQFFSFLLYPELRRIQMVYYFSSFLSTTYKFRLTSSFSNSLLFFCSFSYYRKLLSFSYTVFLYFLQSHHFMLLLCVYTSSFTWLLLLFICQ